MSLVSPEMTVNEVLRRWPASADIISEFGLDMCCGGGLPLAAAVQAPGADLGALLARLEQVAQQSAAAKA